MTEELGYVGSVNIGTDPKWQLSIEMYTGSIRNQSIVKMVATSYDHVTDSTTAYEGYMGEIALIDIASSIDTMSALTVQLDHGHTMWLGQHPVLGYNLKIGREGTYSQMFSIGKNRSDCVSLFYEARLRLRQSRLGV